MSNLFSNNPARRAEELALRMLEHGLSDAEHAELLQCLQQDDAAREQFLEQAFLHSLLREQSGACQPGSLASQLFGVRPEELSELNARLIEAREPSSISTPIAPVLTELDSGPQPHGLSGFFRASGFALSAFLAVVAIATVAAMLLVNSPSQPAGTEHEIAGTVIPPAAPVSSESLEVRSVRLDYGTTRLSLPKVGYVIIEGPAELDLLGPMRARLTSGRIKMRVTEATGKGFVVETPYGDITDLGTEFGVDLTKQGRAGLVVFEGAVDLRVAESKALDGARVERLVGGEGVVFNRGGHFNRVSSIFTGNIATFSQNGETSIDPPALTAARKPLLIIEVDDSLRTKDTKKFYEVVPGGLREDAKAYADATHEWNGITSDGIPPYLIGADYVKTFNHDSIRKKFGICVTLARPAKLYIFLDARSTPPKWLEKDFHNTGDRIGLDAWKCRRFPDRTLSAGAGQAIDDEFTIWEREIREPGKVVLGTNLGAFPTPAMYGIAAMPLDAVEAPSPPK